MMLQGQSIVPGIGMSGLAHLPEQATIRQETQPMPPSILQQTMTSTTQREIGFIPFRDLVIASDPTEARCFQDQIEGLLQQGRASTHDIFSIRLALEEALINAIKHGNQLDRNKKVCISYRILDDRFEVQIRDEGTGFDPAEVPDPTAIENLERPCGRGLMLMRHYMNNVDYNSQGNTVTMSRIFRNGK
jgi:serine/threonine-protein kinase RsbW